MLELDTIHEIQKIVYDTYGDNPVPDHISDELDDLIALALSRQIDDKPAGWWKRLKNRLTSE